MATTEFEFTQHTDTITDIDQDGDNRILSADEDANLYIWSRDNGLIKSFDFHTTDNLGNSNPGITTDGNLVFTFDPIEDNNYLFNTQTFIDNDTTEGIINETNISDAVINANDLVLVTHNMELIEYDISDPANPSRTNIINLDNDINNANAQEIELLSGTEVAVGTDFNNTNTFKISKLDYANYSGNPDTVDYVADGTIPEVLDIESDDSRVVVGTRYGLAVLNIDTWSKDDVYDIHGNDSPIYTVNLLYDEGYVTGSDGESKVVDSSFTDRDTYSVTNSVRASKQLQSGNIAVNDGSSVELFDTDDGLLSGPSETARDFTSSFVATTTDFSADIFSDWKTTTTTASGTKNITTRTEIKLDTITTSGDFTSQIKTDIINALESGSAQEIVDGEIVTDASTYTSPVVKTRDGSYNLIIEYSTTNSSDSEQLQSFKLLSNNGKVYEITLNESSGDNLIVRSEFETD